jgi:hypothetical protein
MAEERPQPQPPRYSETDKLYWEVERLKEETKNLKRPFWRNPSYLVTVMTIIVAVFGMALQYYKSDFAYQQAEVKTQIARLQLEKIGDETQRAQAAYQRVQQQLKEADERLASLRAQAETGNFEAIKTDLQQNPATISLFDNTNIYAVGNGPPTRPTQFTLDAAYYVTGIWNYHWNNGRGVDPQGRTISVRHNDGTVYGPFRISTSSGQGGAANVNWESLPNVLLPAGTYTVIDPDPATWSQNEQSENSGFSKVRGYKKL